MEEKDQMRKLELYLGISYTGLIILYRNKEKNEDGSEKEITYGEYVDKINKRALKNMNVSDAKYQLTFHDRFFTEKKKMKEEAEAEERRRLENEVR